MTFAHYKGEVVEVISNDGIWAQIKFSDATKGFVHTAQLQF